MITTKVLQSFKNVDLSKIYRSESLKTYRQLPRLPFYLENKQLFKFGFEPLRNVLTAIWAPALTAAYPLSLSKTFQPARLSQKCVETQTSTEQKIQALAKKMGIISSEKIKVCVAGNESGRLGENFFPAAMGSTYRQPVVLMQPQWLLNPEDLPSNLSVDRINAKTISVDEWISNFEFWLLNEFTEGHDPFSSKLTVDTYRLCLQLWLKAFCNQELYQKLTDFLLGHELGHIHHADHLKNCLATLGLQLLAFPLTPFVPQILNAVNNCSSEKRADLFSVDHLGGEEAAIWFFQEVQKIQTILAEKYPELVIEKKQTVLSRFDKTHPSPAERIKYIIRNSISA